MRHSLIIVIFCLITSCVFASQQIVPKTGDSTFAVVQDDITSAVAAAINTGDAKKLASFSAPASTLPFPAPKAHTANRKPK